MSSMKRSVVPQKTMLRTAGMAGEAGPAIQAASASRSSIPPIDQPIACHSPSGSSRKGRLTASRSSSIVRQEAYDT
ncbi:hypothetical protein M3650_25150 [Paenibacillus sp. MER TA 81-3]|nr:hypothetical protein [Paenibacillus sp. MER TA 81-3]MCM3341824.1 hypothetical protein [Paenibacillus sp. MER TA 81-3]